AQRAAEIGSQAHRLIEWHLRRELGLPVKAAPNVSDKALLAFTAYEDWRRTVQLRPLAIEHVVWSAQHRYAGTLHLDAEMVLNGEVSRVVLDWKTTRRVFEEALLQNAAYVQAAVEMGEAAPVHGLIVRLPKTEAEARLIEVRTVPWESQARLFEVFLA